MNIGIDIDGVLTDIRKFTIEEGLKYCKQNHKGKLTNPDAYYSNDVFGWDIETDLDFWFKHIFKYAEENPPLPGVASNIKKLKEDGHKLYIITARWLASPKTEKQFGEGEELKEKMRKTVKEWLKKNNIIYDEIIFSEEDKSNHILEKKIDIMIEDSPQNLKQLSQITKMICYDWGYNQGIENEDIYRCKSWDEIYTKIKELGEFEGIQDGKFLNRGLKNCKLKEYEL